MLDSPRSNTAPFGTFMYVAYKVFYVPKVTHIDGETFLTHLINVLKPVLVLFVENLWPSVIFVRQNWVNFPFFFYKNLLFYKRKKENWPSFASQKWEGGHKFPTKITQTGFKRLIKCVRNVFPNNLMVSPLIICFIKLGIRNL